MIGKQLGYIRTEESSIAIYDKIVGITGEFLRLLFLLLNHDRFETLSIHSGHLSQESLQLAIEQQPSFR